MYPNLRGEMARKNITLTKLAEELGIRLGTLSSKNAGKTPFTLDEAMAIKEALKTDIPLEELFEREER